MNDKRLLIGIILSIGLVMALNIIVFAVLWDALHGDAPGLSENATQILTGAFGGIIGILGSFLGFQVADSRRNQEQESRPNVEPD